MLSHDVVGEGSRTAIFLHGILGNRNNWQGFCRRVCDRVPDLRCVVVDLRGHGSSHDLPPPHTVDACVDDVLALGLAPDVVVGHSFGGKVALALAARAPAGLRDVATLDCPPGPRGNGMLEIERVIEAVREVPVPVASRRDLVSALRAQELSEALCQWMTTNVRPSDRARGGFAGGLTWTFDLDVVTELLASFGAADLWPALELTAPRIHVVRAGRGARFSPEDIARLATTKAHNHVVENAGHWLHTDNPDGTLDVLAPILSGGLSGEPAV